MLASEYQRLALRTANLDVTRPKNSWANFGLGLAGEAGEVADLIKKHVFHGHELDKPKLLLELGDVAWHLPVLCHLAGFTLDEVLLANIKKLEARYPEGFSTEASINRADVQPKPKDIK